MFWVKKKGKKRRKKRNEKSVQLIMRFHFGNVKAKTKNRKIDCSSIPGSMRKMIKREALCMYVCLSWFIIVDHSLLFTFDFNKCFYFLLFLALSRFFYFSPLHFENRFCFGNTNHEVVVLNMTLIDRTCNPLSYNC